MKLNNIISYTQSRRRSLTTSVARFVYVVMLIATMSVGLASCSNDGYATGDNGNSYLTADLALLHTNSSKAAYAATLDDGTLLQITNPFVTKWMEKADTIYRALLYYDKTDDTNTQVKARSVVQVPVMGVAKAADVKEMYTDPLDVESVWTAKNDTYINMSLLLKSGTASDVDARQSIGLVLEQAYTDGDGLRHAVLRMYHNQNGVPEYYTVQQYASVDAKQLGADVVELHVNTYKGEIVKTIELKP